MKRIILSLFAVAAYALMLTAQNSKCLIQLKDGTQVTYSVGDIDNMSWVIDEEKSDEEKSDDHEWVDLGLPSGIKWATCNVGAEKPEDYGWYLAWGETKPKDTYDWSTYKYMADGYSDWDGCSKYQIADGQTKGVWYNWYGTFVGDNKTVLYPEDDAAHANWGGNWRMPTDAELTELRSKCTWTWTSQNGVDGMKVTGPNGNSIFLPAAGYRYEGSLVGVGLVGDCWSSSLYGGLSYQARGVYFASGYVDSNVDNRYCGQSVRPVCSE